MSEPMKRGQYMIEPGRPKADEYDPAFAGYVARIAEEESVVTLLSEQSGGVTRRFDGVPETRGDYRYATGKWSLKEVIGHLSDTERVFAYRALRIGRGDATALVGFDDQSYVARMHAEDLSLVDVVNDWQAVRAATLTLFRNLSTAAWQRRGTASGHPISVRALAYVIAGHTRHHLAVIDERYGG
jgi:hypothetical protein